MNNVPPGRRVFRRPPFFAGLLAVLALAGFALAGWQTRALRQTQAVLAAQAGSLPQAVTPGLVDARFAQFMRLHHEQALLLSQIVLADPQSRVTPLAQGVRTQQLMEVGEMRGWLKLWDAPSVPPDRSMYWMLQSKTPLDARTRQYLIDCRQSPGGMAGLASEAEIQSLRVATGRARDALFLDLMRRHHEGGIPMARFAAREARLAPVRELAARIAQEQETEVAAIRMAQATGFGPSRAAVR